MRYAQFDRATGQIYATTANALRPETLAVLAAQGRGETVVEDHVNGEEHAIDLDTMKARLI